LIQRNRARDELALAKVDPCLHNECSVKLGAGLVSGLNLKMWLWFCGADRWILPF